jgi:hypothetical protein
MEVVRHSVIQIPRIVYKQDGGQRKTGRFTKLFMLLQEFTAIHAQRTRAPSPTNRQRAFSNSNYRARFCQHPQRRNCSNSNHSRAISQHQL